MSEEDGASGITSAAVPPQAASHLPISFLHVPRTAGFSLKQMFEWSVGARRTLLDAHFLGYEALRGRLDEFDFIEGHAGAGFLRRLIGPNWHLNGVTLLREPVARVVSQARHLRYRANHFNSETWDGLRSELTDPRAAFEHVATLTNLQTKMLAGRHPRELDVSEDALIHAKGLLKGLTFGITDQFLTSLVLIGDRFRLPFPRVVRTNAGAASGDEDLRGAEFRTAAAEHNALDIELYHFATELLASRVAAYCDEWLGLDLDEARLEGTLVWPRVPKSRPDPGAIRVHAGGWFLLDGELPESVFVCCEDQVSPLVCRLYSSRAAATSRLTSARYAGVLGVVTAPAGGGTVRVVAIDRSRGLRGEMTIQRSLLSPNLPA